MTCPRCPHGRAIDPLPLLREYLGRVMVADSPMAVLDGPVTFRSRTLILPRELRAWLKEHNLVVNSHTRELYRCLRKLGFWPDRQRLGPKLHLVWARQEEQS